MKGEHYMIVLKSKDGKSEPEAIQKWFDWLHDEGQRGERARLRRCESLDEILLQPAFYRLCLAVPRFQEHDLEGLATAAGLLAMVKNPTRESFPKLLGKGKDKPALSELRFQRLLTADNPDDFFKTMRRALAHIDGKADPVELTDEVLHWYDQKHWPEHYRGEKQWRYRYAKRYYIQPKT